MSTRWLAIVGFWWSVATLIYSTRTVQEFVTPYWERLGVDLVGRAVMPLAFFLGLHIILALLRALDASRREHQKAIEAQPVGSIFEKTKPLPITGRIWRLRHFALPMMYPIAATFVVAAFVADQYRLPLAALDAARFMPTEIPFGIGMLAGSLTGACLAFVRMLNEGRP